MHPSQERSDSVEERVVDRALSEQKDTSIMEQGRGTDPKIDFNEHGFRRIIRNFTPSYVHLRLGTTCDDSIILNRWFIITMSTGVLSILLHQLPYNGHWLQIFSIVFFVINLVLFLLFTLITCLRYILYPPLFPAVLRHPHQSLFLATFPIGLATLINMSILVCAPAWGQGMVTFAWVLWWIVSALALSTCFHLTYVM